MPDHNIQTQLFLIRYNMFSCSGVRWILLISLVCIAMPCASPLPDRAPVTYSFVHISDIQSLTTHHPDTLDLTFSRIESLKETCNISAIIITGDLVNTWNDPKDWAAYHHARNLTTIPVYEIAGNHDTDGRQPLPELFSKHRKARGKLCYVDRGF